MAQRYAWRRNNRLKHKRVQTMGGITAVVLSGFCEHNNQVHKLVDMFATRAGPEAEAETGLDSKSVVAYERHCIRLRMVAGAWYDYHESIHVRLRFFHSSTNDAAIQEEL